ncbi:hypothetical protein OSCT_2201 [Oscillochloris trichoides DG-6]|uniref:Uncharacterized protein n=1 Tax=Oscillochloris trichoides DG-6 TaxID=765420 RepID=E1IFV0_9CHLR|nr:hypothetical protein [Oscillochloris trichoides]EFO79908.1 hypothetical protein OSCT_2201 [Oscillochloris trichoides DG-6]
MEKLRFPVAGWALLAYCILSVALTWPLAPSMAHTMPEHGDALFQAWVLAWDAHALTTNPGQIWHAPIFYPYPNSLAFSDSLLPLALLGLPFLLLLGPIASYNLLTLFSLTLSAWAVFLLARDTLADTRLPAAPVAWAAGVAGLAFASSAYLMSHLFHLQLLQTYWLILALWALRRLLHPQPRPRLRYALLVGLFAGVQAATTLYYAFFVALVLAGYAALWVLLRLWLRVRTAERFPWAQLAWGGLAALIAGVVALPFLLPYSQVYATLGIVRSLRELDNWSAPLSAYLALPATNRSYVAAGQLFVGTTEAALFPGALVLLFALVGVGRVVRGVRRYLHTPQLLLDLCFWPLLALGAFVLSLGTAIRLTPEHAPLPIPSLYALLWAHLPGFGALRVPARWGWLVTLALVLAAAVGLAFILARMRPRGRVVLAGAVALLMLAEQRVVPLNLPDPAPLQPSLVTQWLAEPAQADLQVVLELPLPSVLRGEHVYTTIRRQWLAQYHWRSMPVAYSGAIPFGTNDMLARAQALPSDAALSFFQLIGVDALLVQRDEMTPEAAQAMITGLQASPRVRHRADVGTSSLFELLPDPRIPQIRAAAAGGSIYLSADERIPGLIPLALIPALEQSGIPIYGPGRSRYYPPQMALPIGMVPAAALLSDAENPLDYGYPPSALVWQGDGVALYQRPATTLASLSLAQPVVGQFHRAFPAYLNITPSPGQVQVGDQVLYLDTATPLVIELDCAQLAPGPLQIGDQRLDLPAGLSRVRVPLTAATTLRGSPDLTALLRLRIVAGSLDQPEVLPEAALVATAQTSFAGDALNLRVQAAGRTAILVDGWGAASLDDRPIHLLAGEVALDPDGRLDLTVSLLDPTGAWLTEHAEPQDGRYILYIKDPAHPDGPGQPVAKFFIRAGQVVQPEPVPLPLTVVR